MPHANLATLHLSITGWDRLAAEYTAKPAFHSAAMAKNGAFIEQMDSQQPYTHQPVLSDDHKLQ
jgi:hypothetical protein